MRRMLCDLRPHRLPRLRFVTQLIHQHQQVRLHHVAVVEIRVEDRPIAIHAVAQVPRVQFVERVGHAHAVPVRAQAK